MIARCIALGLPIAEVPIRTIYAGEPSHIRPWAHFTSFLRVSRDARRIVAGRPVSTPLTAGDVRSTPSPWRDRLQHASPGPVRTPCGRHRAGARRGDGRRPGTDRWVRQRVTGLPPRRGRGRASSRGTGPAVATAIGSFLAYDYLFIEPLHTLTVRDPAEWLNLILLLVVGIVVGRLAGRERDRANRGDRT